MKANKQLLIYLGSFYLILFLCVISFYFFNPFSNSCIKGNCENGYGIYAFHSGMRYEGEWKDGKRNGQGTLTYPDSSKYVGEWKNNRMHGYGIKTYNVSNLYKYAGEWKSGLKNGKGVQYFSPEEWFEGEWEKGEMHGHGIYTGIGGRKLEGEWKYGIKNGPGTEIYPDGRVFKGEWKNGEKHGKGTLTYPNSTKITGEWVHNRLVGSSDFYMIEFEGAYNIVHLCSAIKADVDISLKAKENTVEWLNELLMVPNLYEELYKKMRNQGFYGEIITLIENTKDFRSKSFSELNNDSKEDIKRLNRLLLEYFYPNKTPKVEW